MKKIDIRVLAVARAEVGEGAVWCERRHCLWWVDIGRCELHRYDPATGRDQNWPMPGKIGCAALTQGEALIVALSSGLHLFNPDNGALSHLCNLPKEPQGNRPNDGAVSRAGRFYVGTIPLVDRFRPNGRLYAFDGKQARHVLSGLHVANGLAFSPDDRTAYLSDSWPDIRTIWAFDHDPDDGALTNRRIFFDTSRCAGRPDGACVDSDGCYWMAGVGGGEVLRLTPRGEIDLRIALPVRRPSRPCFGGPNLNTLYITSIGLDAPEDSNEGALLSIEMDYQGLAEARVNMTGA